MSSSRCCDDCAWRIYYEERAKATCWKAVAAAGFMYLYVYIYIYIYVYIHMLYRLQDLIFFASRVYAGSSLIFFVCVHAIENSAMDVFLAEGPKMSLGHPYRNYGIAVHELFLV